MTVLQLKNDSFEIKNHWIYGSSIQVFVDLAVAVKNVLGIVMELDSTN